MDQEPTAWKRRALPSVGAVRTAVRTADDGHELVADLIGQGHALGEPHQLRVACQPLHDPEGVDPLERWPTLQELLGAADELAPGDVFSLVFVAQPDGMVRGAPPPGPRVLEASQIGVAQPPSLIDLAPA